MKIAIIGAGAVGGYYGAKLALAGNDVTMIGRAKQVDAMLTHGLILETGGQTVTASVKAAEELSAIANAELVLFCVKSGDTETAATEAVPHLRGDAIVLSLQNGVDNAEKLGAILRTTVTPAAVYVAAELIGPGRVRHNGRGELIIGDQPSSARVADLLTSAGVETEVSFDVLSVLWTKLTINCAYNALCAIGHLPYGTMITVPGAREVMTAATQECIEVAAKLNVRLPSDILATVLALASAMPKQLSSTAQDLQNGRRSEIEHLNGFVVRAAERLKIDVPTNRLLLVAVRMLEHPKTV